MLHGTAFKPRSDFCLVAWVRLTTWIFTVSFQGEETPQVWAAKEVRTGWTQAIPCTRCRRLRRTRFPRR